MDVLGRETDRLQVKGRGMSATEKKRLEEKRKKKMRKMFKARR